MTRIEHRNLQSERRFWENWAQTERDASMRRYYRRMMQDVVREINERKEGK